MATQLKQIQRNRTTGKVRPHQTQNEGLVFEKSAPGKRGYKLPPLDVPEVDAQVCWALPIARSRRSCPS